MAPATLINLHDSVKHAERGDQARALIKKAIIKHIASIDQVDHSAYSRNDIYDDDLMSEHESESGAAFFVADLGEVYRQHIRWMQHLPRVIPHYAVKCNPDNEVLRLLADLGTGFDCASKAEIQQVLDLGVKGDRIIYANPCKAASYIRYAGQVGVQATTFDNAEELHKIAKINPGAQLYLRIVTDDSGALCQLGLKYGAPLNTTGSLLRLARELRLNVVGVSFHIGSGSSDPFAFVDAVHRARSVFDEAILLGFDMHTLDIGGGFGHDNFEKFAAVITPCLDELFDDSVRIIAEPGRYYVAAAFTLATQVIARRTVFPDSEAEPLPGTTSNNFMYYVNDGVYGSFNCIMFDHQNPQARILTHAGKNYFGVPSTAPVLQKQRVRCSIWGPTCDSLDCISSESYLPFVMDTGDWLYFDEMGAYTRCAASKFNGFNLSKVIYINSEI
ncbi:Ornithine decarboxylase [Taphrina deformans PYCC 5710]|uniref:Ornithine decarboxylase n=1 Tax=Taphrina deformans (strain PYCC 5710 / ATCC 11124 / CBS 356.35 / IMI 108563 / JCM 9778 / NBRC 8474) TaxID=1097556 RepID=R4X8W3_TAPDE|nr:Ornithine decarboxylase [Taphrina deformans PYCC 5710]|eukprot:CCG82094.1 Ornithine decarboxylase [Taphrina deformans PYCC 5710]